MNVSNYERTILAAILPNDKNRLLHALQHLEPEHFTSEVERKLFILLDRYYGLTNGVLSRDTLEDLLTRQGVDAGKRLQYMELYQTVEEQSVAFHEYLYAISALKDQRSHILTGEAFTESFEVLERGAVIDGVELQGHEAARNLIYGRLAKIDKLNNAEASPEGEMKTEAEDLLAEYAARKSGKNAAGIMTGLPSLDNQTSGMQPGELVLTCAFTGQGKSQMTTQTCWSAAVEQGKNFFFATSETTRAQVIRRIHARHSRLPQFGLEHGLNVRDIKDGTLSAEEEKIYQAVVKDLQTNPNYGKMYVAQIPRGAQLGFVEARMQRQQSMWNIDLLAIDYLALLKPDTKRSTSREEFNDILKDAKTFATSFNDGKGVVLMSPWQMSQVAWRNALDSGFYTLANLAETSEAERSADQIISILRSVNNPKSAHLQLLKNRDGDTPKGFDVELGYHCAYLGEKVSSTYTSGGVDMGALGL